MRKEFIWAIFAGITFGIVVGFGVWRINSSLKPNNTQIKPSPTPGPNTSTELKITLDKPENEDVVTDNSVTVSGLTKALAWVVVSGENGDLILQANNNGTFQQDVDLNPGVNQIKVSAFDKGGNESATQVLVVYSSFFQKNTIMASPSPSNATGESAIRQKVEEKVAAALMQPKAFLGTVTDITDSTIQVKSIEGDIKQISATPDSVSVINSTDDSSREVKLTDIAIGDFIVAMGYKGSNNVLIAQRILITDPVKPPQITVNFGKVTDTGVGTITVTPLKGEAVGVTPNYLTDIETLKNGKETAIRLTSISENDIVIYVMDVSKTTPKVRSIFDISTSK